MLGGKDVHAQNERATTMKAYATITNSVGQETLTVWAEDFSPFIALTVRGTTVDMTRDEARRVCDALRAAGLRRAYGEDQVTGPPGIVE